MVGKRVRGALYVHRQAVGHLPADLAHTLARAETVASDDEWNVARLEPDVVGLLRYEDFDQSAFPSLLGATRVDLKSGNVRRTSYTGSANPLILHRKELLVDPAHPQVQRWSATTQMLEKRGAFVENHRIGRAREWRNRLAGMGLAVSGDEVLAT